MSLRGEMQNQKLELRLFEHHVAEMKAGRLSEVGRKFIEKYVAETSSRKLARMKAKNKDLQGQIAMSGSRVASARLKARMAADPSIKSIAAEKPTRRRFKMNEQTSELVALGGCLDFEQIGRLLGAPSNDSQPADESAQQRARRQLEEIREAARRA
jgi:hypothetical protein